MSEGLPTVIRRDGEAASRARPLVEGARVLKARVVEELSETEEELGRLRAEARRQVEEAEEEAEEIRQEARRQGRKEALEECMEDLAKARAEYAKLKQRAERDMVTLAFEVARRLLGHKIEVQPEIVRDIVGQALTAARGREQIVVHVHPDDHDEVQAERDRYARSLEGIPVYFEVDADLDRGDCVIETESGRIDARLDTQLQVMREALEERAPLQRGGADDR